MMFRKLNLYSLNALIGKKEYGGNLNAAVSAHFLELERSMYGSTPLFYFHL